MALVTGAARGAARVCAAVLPGMRDQRFGRIVNLSSVIGLVGLQRRTAYSTAKAAIWPVDGGYAANGNPGEDLGPVQALD